MKNGPYELVVAPLDYPGKRYREKYCYEHHLVFWEWTGELVPNNYQLHHKNANKRDNRPENLELVTIPEHGLRHMKPPNVKCVVCGKLFHVTPYKLLKPRPPLCSRKCIGKLYGRGKDPVKVLLKIANQ